MRSILFIILIVIISSCSSKRKVNRMSSVYEFTGHSVSNEKGNTETSSNLKIDKTVETYSDGETTEENVVIKSLDSTKESYVQLQDGTKVVLKNAIYKKTKVFKKENTNKKEILKLDSIAETKIDFKKEEVIDNEISSEIKTADIDKEVKSFNWLYILIPGVVAASGYILYKINPQLRLFNIFRKT